MLRLDDLHVSYGASMALDGVSLEVGGGEVVGLIGSNGAGKSTLLKTVSGLVRPRAGRITFCGERIDGLPAHAVFERGIAHVPEGRKIFGNLTVLENLRLGALFSVTRGRIDERLEELFAEFPILAERRAQLGGTLSGGEQQILAISRGLMSEPKFLLLDEPSLGLSPIMAQQVFAAIGRIAASGISILLVEQDMFAAFELAARGYVLEVGRVSMSGPSAELIDDPHLRQAYLGIEA